MGGGRGQKQLATCVPRSDRILNSCLGIAPLKWKIHSHATNIGISGSLGHLWVTGMKSYYEEIHNYTGFKSKGRLEKFISGQLKVSDPPPFWPNPAKSALNIGGGRIPPLFSQILIMIEKLQNRRACGAKKIKF